MRLTDIPALNWPDSVSPTPPPVFQFPAASDTPIIIFSVILVVLAAGFIFYTLSKSS